MISSARSSLEDETKCVFVMESSALAAKKKGLLSHPLAVGLVSGIISAVVGGLIVVSWQNSDSHQANDAKRDAAEEIRTQLQPFEQSLSAKIDTLQKEITEQGKLVERIRGKFGIAKIETTPRE